MYQGIKENTKSTREYKQLQGNTRRNQDTKKYQRVKSMKKVDL